MRSFRLLPLIPLLAAALAAMPIETADPVTDFLRRLEEKGLVEVGFWSTLPRDESEVARVLAEAAKQEHRLGKWDRRRLHYYLELFDPERKRAGTRFSRRDSSFELHGTVEYFTGGYARDSIPRAEAFAFGSLSPGVEIEYRQWAYLLASATVSMERDHHPRFTGENYLPENGLPFNVNRDGLNTFSGTVSTFDGFRVVAGAGTEGLRLEGGQDWNQWGPGHWQHTTLGTTPFFWVSDSLGPSPEPGFHGRGRSGSYRRGYRYPGEGPPMPQLRLRFGSGRWEYVKVVAQRTGLWKDSAALLVAHRLQVRAGSWRFGATEMLALGGRGQDWLLLLPAVPLKFAEHAGGNRDNSALSADAEWIWRGYGRLYGELFLDDFSGLPLDYWGDKFAWLAGMSLHDPFGVPSEWRAEYARVDPWVYSHHLHGTQMQSYGALLGSSLPPNSHALFASVRFPFFAEITGGVEGSLRQRDFRSPGSSIFDVYSTSDGFYKQFLANGVETRRQAVLTAERNWGRFVEIRGGAGWLYVEDWNGQKGRDLSTPSLQGEIFLKY